MDELETLAKAVEIAEKNGLLIEFIWSYGMEMAIGHQSNEAATAALYEWDM